MSYEKKEKLVGVAPMQGRTGVRHVVREEGKTLLLGGKLSALKVSPTSSF